MTVNITNEIQNHPPHASRFDIAARTLNGGSRESVRVLDSRPWTCAHTQEKRRSPIERISSNLPFAPGYGPIEYRDQFLPLTISSNNRPTEKLSITPPNRSDPGPIANNGTMFAEWLPVV